MNAAVVLQAIVALHNRKIEIADDMRDTLALNLALALDVVLDDNPPTGDVAAVLEGMAVDRDDPPSEPLPRVGTPLQVRCETCRSGLVWLGEGYGCAKCSAVDPLQAIREALS